MNRNHDKPEWTTWPEAFHLFSHGVTLRACFPVAIIVGLILSTINQSDVIASGAATTVTWLKVAMNFAVPFCVSSYGFLKGCRVEGPRLALVDELQS